MAPKGAMSVSPATRVATIESTMVNSTAITPSHTAMLKRYHCRKIVAAAAKSKPPPNQLPGTSTAASAALTLLAASALNMAVRLEKPRAIDFHWKAIETKVATTIKAAPLQVDQPTMAR